MTDRRQVLPQDLLQKLEKLQLPILKLRKQIQAELVKQGLAGAPRAKRRPRRH